MIINLIKLALEYLKRPSPNYPGGYSIPVPENKELPSINSSYLDIKVGDIAAKYETSNRGVGFISNGMNGADPGGISYGKYQLETNKGTMSAYLNSKESGKYGLELKQYPINSPKFKALWKQLAKDEPEPFNYSQFLFLANKPGGYVDAYNWAKQNGWNVENLAMQSAIYSTVNQSGGWKSGIFTKAGISLQDSLIVQINKLYDARAAYFKRIKINEAVRRSIIQNRTVLERKDVLKLL